MKVNPLIMLFKNDVMNRSILHGVKISELWKYRPWWLLFICYYAIIHHSYIATISLFVINCCFLFVLLWSMDHSVSLLPCRVYDSSFWALQCFVSTWMMHSFTCLRYQSARQPPVPTSLDDALHPPGTDINITWQNCGEIMVCDMYCYSL